MKPVKLQVGKRLSLSVKLENGKPAYTLAASFNCEPEAITAMLRLFRSGQPIELTITSPQAHLLPEE